jgi:hypothetical protein
MKEFMDAIDKFKRIDFQAWLDKNQERVDVDEFLKCVSEAFDLTNMFQANSFRLFPSRVNKMYSVFFNDNNIELKPCPFCGGKASIVPEDESENHSCDGWFQLGCMGDVDCPSHRVFSFPKKDQDLCIEKWNTRK